MGYYTKVDKKYYEKQKEERLGESNITHQGRKIIIVEYYDATKVVVEFEDGVRKTTSYKGFKLGTVRYPKSKLVRTKPLEEERKNEIVTNKEGYQMFIAEYHSSRDIIVEFMDEYHAKVHTEYKCFKKGGVKNPYMTGKYGEITGDKYNIRENNRKTKEYNTWRGILHRVFESDRYKNTIENYKDVIIDESWLFFPNFYEWLVSQDNYDKWKNNKEYRWDIDKDILSDPFNKKYSPNTCCLVPSYVNAGITRKNNDKSSNLPIGVYQLNKRYFYYGDDNKKIKFNTVEETEKEYRKYKQNKIIEIAERAYSNKDITQRCYEGLLKYQYFIND